MADYELWYFINGKVAASRVIISEDKLIVDLRQEIHKESCSGLCHAWELVLFKVDIAFPQDMNTIQTLQVENGVNLNPMERIQHVWPDRPIRGRLHVCVKLPSEPPRKRLKTDDAERKYLNGPLGMVAPSSVAKHNEVYNMQNWPEQRIANDRPDFDADQLPIALLYHGFGRFLDVASGTTDPVFTDTDRQEFENTVGDFMTFMNIYYPKEEDRNDVALQFLNTIFECYPGGDTQRPQHRMSDGHALGPAKTVEVVLQVKNELGAGNTDPSVEISAYYTQSLKGDFKEEILSSFIFPALGIVVIGSHIGFYALAFPGSTRLVALTPLLPTTAEIGNNWVKPALLNAFKAACVLRYHIYEDTNKISTLDRRSLPIIRKELPYVNEVAVYPALDVASGSAEVICFHIQAEAYQGTGQLRNPNQFLYLAYLDDTSMRLIGSKRREVIVKFTRQYFPQLHSFCAERGHAPRLLGYGLIPGGWHVVVMEWIKQGDTNVRQHASNHLSRWSKDLKSLVDDFHDKGWVHGDLRDVNLIVSDKEPEQVMLIDFDWGGDVGAGSVYYPTTLLNDELKKPEHPFDLLITREHDDRVFTFTLNKLATPTPTSL